MKAFAGVLFVLLISISLSAQQNFNSFSYSSYFGGSGTDIIDDVAVDSAGNIYILGTTSTPDFNYPSQTGIDYQGGFSDIFVAMLTPDARQVAAFTYFGGSMRDEARSIAVKNNQDVVVTGITNSPQLLNSAFSYKNTLTDSVEAFAVIFPSGLTALQVSSYLGGTANGFDEAVAVAVKPSNRLLVGFSAIPDVTLNLVPEDTARGNDELVLLELDELLVGGYKATFFGGTGHDYLGDLALDGNGEIYATGWTSSDDLPNTNGTLQDTSRGGMDGYVTVWDSNFSLLRTTYFGGGSYDRLSQVEISGSSQLIVAGISYSESIWLGSNGLRDTLGLNISDIIVANLSTDLSEVTAFTYLGGSQLEYLNETILAGNGDILLAGSTRSRNFPTDPNAGYDFIFGGPEDGYAIQLNSGLTEIKTSTYIGDTLTESCNALALGKNGLVIQAGYTTSPHFKLSDAAEDTVFVGLSEGFIVTTELYPSAVTLLESKPGAQISVAGNRAVYQVPAGKWRLRVFDIMGRAIYQTSLGRLSKGRYEKSLPLDEKGFYILLLVSSEEAVAQKFYFPGR